MLSSNGISEKASGRVREVSVHVDGRRHNINACDNSVGYVVTDLVLII